MAPDVSKRLKIRGEDWRQIVMRLRDIHCVPATNRRAVAGNRCIPGTTQLSAGGISHVFQRQKVVRRGQLSCSAATNSCPPERTNFSTAHKYLSPAHNYNCSGHQDNCSGCNDNCSGDNSRCAGHQDSCSADKYLSPEMSGRSPAHNDLCVALY